MINNQERSFKMKNKLKKVLNLSDEAISIVEAIVPLDGFKITLEDDGLFPGTKRNVVIDRGTISDNDYAYAIFRLGENDSLEVIALYADQKHLFHEKIHGIISPNKDYSIVFSGYTNASGTERKVLGKQDAEGFSYYGPDKYYQITHQEELAELVSPDINITASELDGLLGEECLNSKARILTGRIAFKKLCQRDLISKKKDKDGIKFN